MLPICNQQISLHILFHTGAYTARRYALWQSRQAVLNAQLTGPTGASNSQLDTEAAAADAIAALGQFKKLNAAQECCRLRAL